MKKRCGYSHREESGEAVARQFALHSAQFVQETIISESCIDLITAGMDLTYYETRLQHDMSRECYSNMDAETLQDTVPCSKQLTSAVSSSLSQLLIDITALFEDDVDDDDESRDSEELQKEKEFDILQFTERLMRRTREEVKDCIESIMTLADLLNSVKISLERLGQSSEALIEEGNSITVNSNAEMKSADFWLRGAVEKLKLHTFQLIKETYLSDEKILPALQIIKDKLDKRKSAQEEENANVCLLFYAVDMIDIIE